MSAQIQKHRKWLWRMIAVAGGGFCWWHTSGLNWLSAWRILATVIGIWIAPPLTRFFIAMGRVAGATIRASSRRRWLAARNSGKIRRLRPLAARINQLEAGLSNLSANALRSKTVSWQQELSQIEGNEELTRRLEEILPEAFAVVKQACRRLLGTEIAVRGQILKWDMVPCESQLIAGCILHVGKVAEITGGEGKTLVAVLPAYLNALVGRGVHVITHNDYLAARDSEWMGNVYKYLGLTVGCVLPDQTPDIRREQYKCDITYGTSAQLGFDYLRDRALAMRKEEQVQRGYHYAVVDDFDVTAIDDARTPLILNNSTNTNGEQAEPKVLATTTIQSHVRLYRKLAGMISSVGTDASDFFENYKCEVISIPHNWPRIRKDAVDSVYKTSREKLNALVIEIKSVHAQGRPVFVSTASSEVANYLSRMLKREGIIHSVLSPIYRNLEPEIIDRAGQRGAVTIVTNMAGRGIDIKLSPDSIGLGGLHVIGTERHESRRLDLQLRGRSARRGAPGTSHFFVSLEDDLMRRFGSDRIVKLMDRMGLEEGQVLEHPLLNASLENAQSRIEAFNANLRKRGYKFDAVLNNQCKAIYDFRDSLLQSPDVRHRLMEVIQTTVLLKIRECTAANFDPNKWKSRALLDWLNLTFPLGITEGQIINVARAGKQTPPAGTICADLSESQFAVSNFALDKIQELYRLKASFENNDSLKALDRFIFLSAIDKFLPEHIAAIESLRRNVNNLPSEKSDPLVQYQSEADNIFTQLKIKIDVEVCRGPFRNFSSLVAFEQFFLHLKSSSVSDIKSFLPNEFAFTATNIPGDLTTGHSPIPATQLGAIRFSTSCDPKSILDGKCYEEIIGVPLNPLNEEIERLHKQRFLELNEAIHLSWQESELWMVALNISMTSLQYETLNARKVRYCGIAHSASVGGLADKAKLYSDAANAIQ